jgi:type II secretory pathway component PulK
MGLESGSDRTAAQLHRNQRDWLAALSGQSAFAKLRRDLAEAMGSYKTSPWRRRALSGQPVELGTKSSP